MVQSDDLLATHIGNVPQSNLMILILDEATSDLSIRVVDFKSADAPKLIQSHIFKSLNSWALSDDILVSDDGHYCYIFSTETTSLIQINLADGLTQVVLKDESVWQAWAGVGMCWDLTTEVPNSVIYQTCCRHSVWTMRQTRLSVPPKIMVDRVKKYSWLLKELWYIVSEYLSLEQQSIEPFMIANGQGIASTPSGKLINVVGSPERIFQIDPIHKTYDLLCVRAKRNGFTRKSVAIDIINKCLYVAICRISLPSSLFAIAPLQPPP